MKILFLEDSQTVADTISNDLSCEGAINAFGERASVSVVTNLADAEKALKGEAKPDVIVADLQLNPDHPDETISFLKPLLARFPIVVCSGYARMGEKHQENCLRAGLDEFVDKMKALDEPVLLWDAICRAKWRFAARTSA